MLELTADALILAGRVRVNAFGGGDHMQIACASTTTTGENQQTVRRIN